jgi:phytoene dehydrogenase-like protein
MAGLWCAIHLQANGRRVVVLESDDAVGGRVRSDWVEGFRLDRGFQVLVTAYPEVKEMLDLDPPSSFSFACSRRATPRFPRMVWEPSLRSSHPVSSPERSARTRA